MTQTAHRRQAAVVPSVEAQPPGEAQSPKLLDRVRAAIRARHYSLRTEEAYVGWVRRFILFHRKRHPAEMGEWLQTASPSPEVESLECGEANGSPLLWTPKGDPRQPAGGCGSLAERGVGS